MTRPAVILALLLVTVACDRGQQDAPGSLLAGETAAFSKVLSSCTELSQTPAAHWCTAVLENLEECTHFLAECQAVNAFENAPDGHFLTGGGLVSANGSSASNVTCDRSRAKNPTIGKSPNTWRSAKDKSTSH